MKIFNLFPISPRDLTCNSLLRPLIEVWILSKWGENLITPLNERKRKVEKRGILSNAEKDSLK